MRTGLLALLLLTRLHAFDTITAAKIFNKLFTAMVPATVVYVYTASPEYREVIVRAENLYLTSSVKTADVILVTTFQDLPEGSEGRLLFATSLALLRKNPSVVGAFYWKKGRVQIEFVASRLRAHHIVLPPAFASFIVEEPS